MTKQLILTIDLGSSGMLLSVFSSSGKLLGEHKQTYTPDTDTDGKATYDINAMYDSMLSSINHLFSSDSFSATDVGVIGVSGMMGGVLGVDKHGSPTFPYTTSLDTRFLPHYENMVRDYGAEIRNVTGTWYPTLAPKVKWMEDLSPESFEKTVKVVPITSYIVGHLSELPPEDWVIDKSLLWMTGLSNKKSQQWDYGIASKLNIDLELLPHIAESTDIVAYTTGKLSTQTSIPVGTPVIAGLGDTPASIVGAGGFSQNVAVDIAGTYPILSMSTSHASYDHIGKVGEIFGSPVPNICHPSVFINGGGLTQKWLADLMFGDNTNHISHYETLSQEAESIAPGSDGLLCNPHFGGRACPPDASVNAGAFVGLNWGHKRAHLYRSFLEALAYDLSLTFSQLSDDLGEQVKEVRGVSGMANNSLWNQMKADILNLPYVEMDNKEATALGTAITAGVSVGLFENFEKAISDICTSKKVYKPRAEIHNAYFPYIEAYRKLIEGTPIPKVDNLSF
ncbi:xylulokinase [Vibrio nigripulchritudo]|uniref:xylulokinase n=1 Tax=Vibrio nigripulchritudo TaxID=28173 RepID=UPI0005FA3C80|nr:FGGY family carbohydrate kinase [Vibrio nigripulchritudo]KJY80261.1 hypothetical protein TW74_05705 [Vibrio nigripulchritudo]